MNTKKKSVIRKKNNSLKASEHQIQCAYFDWFRNKHPDLLAWAIPNGGLRMIATAARLKAEGVMAGVPDVFVAVAHAESHGLFLEFKSAKGTVRPTQKIMMERLRAAGYCCVVVNSIDSAIDATNAYLTRI